jgi:hypothetical protein
MARLSVPARITKLQLETVEEEQEQGQEQGQEQEQEQEQGQEQEQEQEEEQGQGQEQERMVEIDPNASWWTWLHAQVAESKLAKTNLRKRTLLEGERPDWIWTFSEPEEYEEEKETRTKGFRRNPPNDGWNCEEDEEEDLVPVPTPQSKASTNALEQAFLLALQQPVQSKKKRRKGKKGKEEENED